MGKLFSKSCTIFLILSLIVLGVTGCSSDDPPPYQPPKIDNSKFHGTFELSVSQGDCEETTDTLVIGNDRALEAEEGYVYIPTDTNSLSYTVNGESVVVTVTKETVEIKRTRADATDTLVMAYSQEYGLITVSGTATGACAGEVAGTAIKRSNETTPHGIVDHSEFFGTFDITMVKGECDQQSERLVIGDDHNRKREDGYLFVPIAENTATYTASAGETTVSVVDKTITVNRSGDDWSVDMVLAYADDFSTITVSGNADDDCSGEITGTALKLADEDVTPEDIDNGRFYGVFDFYMAMGTCEEGTFTSTIGHDKTRATEDNYIYVPQYVNSESFTQDGNQITVTVAENRVTINKTGATELFEITLIFATNYRSLSIVGNSSTPGCQGDVFGSAARVSSTAPPLPPWEKLAMTDYEIEPIKKLVPGAHYNDRLFASAGIAFEAQDLYTSLEIWAFDGTLWSQVNQDGFGDPDNIFTGSTPMAVYAGKLYVAAENRATGAEIWEYDESKVPGDRWRRVNPDGLFGDGATNPRCQSMTVYNNQLHVSTGTSSATGMKVWAFNGTVWTDTSFDTTGESEAISALTVHNGRLFASTLNNSKKQGCEIWSYQESPPVWELEHAGGFGDAANSRGTEMAVFGDRLYVGTENNDRGGEVWRFDNAFWTQSNTDGFGSVNNFSAHPIGVYRDQLYVITKKTQGNSEVWTFDGSQWAKENLDWLTDSFLSAGKYDNYIYITTINGIWKLMETPAGSAWIRLGMEGYDAERHKKLLPGAYLDGNLYATAAISAEDGIPGTTMEVWEHSGSKWFPVALDGFSDPNNIYIDHAGMTVFRENLFVSATNEVTGLEVWQLTERNGDRSTWVQVNEDGFGAPATNRSSLAMAVYNNRLFVAVDREEPGGAIGVWAYDGDEWVDTALDDGGANELIVDMIEYNNRLYLSTFNEGDGSEIWSFDGSAWNLERAGGFGDPNNINTASMVLFQNRLVVGTVNNVTGGQVWEHDGSNWRLINIPGFGNPNNIVVSCIGEHNGNLFVSTGALEDAGMLWEYDGETWRFLVVDGLTHILSVGGPYNNSLYIGDYTGYDPTVWVLRD